MREFRRGQQRRHPSPRLRPAWFSGGASGACGLRGTFWKGLPRGRKRRELRDGDSLGQVSQPGRWGSGQAEDLVIFLSDARGRVAARVGCAPGEP
jgi:hypothetical protein